MHHERRFLLAAGLLGLTSVTVAAASCGSGGSGNTGTGTGAGTGTGGTGTGGTAGTGGTGGSLFNADAGCTTAADCKGGVCVNGACCASAADVCGSLCCTGSTVCLFDKCVTPGKDCHTANDCAQGQYCETALGSQPDGGVPDGGADGGAACTQPLPLGGKCIDLPPVCPGDAGTPPPDAGCVADCEFHPKAGKLNAVVKWQWGPVAKEFPSYTDVWSTPTVGRVHDSNCDGKIDELDAPVIVFVSGDDLAGAPNGTNCQSATKGGANPSMCHTGVLRMLDGRTGKEVWSLDKASPTSVGFAGMSTALGDIDGDGRADVIAVTGEGYVVLIDGDGTVKRTSDKPIPGNGNAAFGWGGGLAIADMDGDGFPEIAFGATVFSTTAGKITLKFTGAFGIGGDSVTDALSTFVDLDGAADNHLELLAGNTAYKADGTVLWNRSVAGTAGPALPDGFPGVGDFNGDGKPDVVLVANGHLWLLNGLDGSTLLGGAAGVAIPGTGSGGPPTVASFDGKGLEIGIAMATFYSVLKPNFTTKTIDVLWQTPNHDLSSSVTGSTVFDFEGDGKAEVIYGDECFLWVFDGTTGAERFAAPHTSFTGTEASLVADVDGDGRAEIVMVTNGASPVSWGCLDAANQPVTVNGVKWTPSTLPNKSYRGIVVYGDSANSWVGTRTLWNEHTYHVSNICDDRDSACPPPNVYGSIPKVETKNWTVPWLNDFRQNVQDKGLFDAPDATVSLTVACSSPAQLTASVRNIGLASLPAGVDVGLYKGSVSTATQIGKVTTTHALFPGQTEQLVYVVPAAMGADTDTYIAQVINDPAMPKFNECRVDNDTSDPATAHCSQ